MKNHFLLEDIILEGRLEDVKKKYSDLDPNIIDYLSENDPSGDNKYLEWMSNTMIFEWGGVENINPKKLPFESLNPSLITYINRLINIVTDFNSNLNKITPELIDEIFIDFSLSLLKR